MKKDGNKDKKDDQQKQGLKISMRQFERAVQKIKRKTNAISNPNLIVRMIPKCMRINLDMLRNKTSATIGSLRDERTINEFTHIYNKILIKKTAS
jgi:hypothetical protein